jgi:predicted heme/steroid binding protein
MALRDDIVLVSSGMSLHPGDEVRSPNGQYRLAFQTDGNLVVYKGSEPLWASNTHGSGADRLVFQADGNLCIYKGGQCVWATMTQGRSPHGHLTLNLQDDGNLCMYDPAKHCHWSTHTAGGNKAPQSAQGKGELGSQVINAAVPHANDAHRGITNSHCVLVSSGGRLSRGERYHSTNRQYYVIFQDDGNLVVYNSSNQPLWGADCHGKGGNRCVFQPDGNLVVYDASNAPIWASNTHGKGSGLRVLNMQDDGNLVIYDSTGRAIWSTGTNGGVKSTAGSAGRMC